jgi:hypothetical protein
MTTDRRRGIARLVAWALVGGLAVAACGGGHDDKKASDDLQKAVDDALNGLDTDTTTAGGDATTPAKLSEIQLDLPRKTTYAGATWTVTRVAYRSAGTDESGTTQPPAVQVNFSVANTDPKAEEMDVDPTMVGLLDKANFRAESSGDLESTTVAAGGKADLKATFDVDEGTTEDDVQGDTFAVGDTESEPALIPFSGTMPGAEYPMTVKMPAAVDGLLLDGGVPGTNRGKATLHDIQATVALDHAGKRAAKGTRFITLQAKVDVHEGDHAYFSSDDLRLSVGGVVQPVVDTALPQATANVPAGSSAAVTWTFTIPAESTTGALAFGSYSPPGTRTGPFTLPTLP